jgi:hypothetical protein
VRGRLLALLAVLAGLVAVVLLRGPSPEPVSPPETESRRPARPPVSAAAPSPGPAWPERDPFRYAEPHERVAPAPAAAAPRPAASAPAPLPTPSALRLIGLVRKGGALKAALSMWGETVVLGAGEESRGYRVLSIDEEAGVKLRGPDGVELDLAPTSS